MNASTCSVVDLPREVLVHIFSYFVKNEGIMKLLNNVANVCVAWKEASLDFTLYRNVNDSKLSLTALKFLLENDALSHTEVLNLSNLKKSIPVGEILPILSHCPKLKVIKLRTTDFMPPKVLQKIPDLCPHLEEIALNPCKFTLNLVFPFTVYGPNLKRLNLGGSHFSNFTKTMNKIAECCPLLEELNLCKISSVHLLFPYQAFQLKCPKLRFLTLEDVVFFASGSTDGPGFPNLRSFTYRVNYGLSMNSTVFNEMLHASGKLQKLDVRGNTSLCSDAFFIISSDHVDSLYLSRTNVNEYTLHYLMSKWKHCLKVLDLSCWKDQNALDCALEQLSNDDQPNLNLEVLNLAASEVSTGPIKKILSKCKNLSYLNIESCRNLPRGVKRIYRTCEEINGLREKLKLEYVYYNKKRKVC